MEYGQQQQHSPAAQSVPLLPLERAQRRPRPILGSSRRTVERQPFGRSEYSDWPDNMGFSGPGLDLSEQPKVEALERRVEALEKRVDVLRKNRHIIPEDLNLEQLGQRAADHRKRRPIIPEDVDLEQLEQRVADLRNRRRPALESASPLHEVVKEPKNAATIESSVLAGWTDEEFQFLETTIWDEISKSDLQVSNPDAASAWILCVLSGGHDIRSVFREFREDMLGIAADEEDIITAVVDSVCRIVPKLSMADQGQWSFDPNSDHGKSDAMDDAPMTNDDSESEYEEEPYESDGEADKPHFVKCPKRNLALEMRLD